MQRIIHKQQLNLGRTFSEEFYFPEKTKFLSIQPQETKLERFICLWYDRPTDEHNLEKYTFHYLFTGDPYVDKAELTYLSTIQRGPLVYHIYYQKHESTD